jgi:glycosyltransferase involved in cell wall biosynthesis
MISSPLVTIGLPVYNSERYLEQSLQSLLTQTFPDFLLIISDNASTDGTTSICRKYADADSRIKYFRNETNIGNPRNFNRVAELTTTKYLKWSTADDFWKPNFLALALEAMERDSTVALCYPQAMIVDASGNNATPYDDVLDLVQEDPAVRFLTLVRTIRLAHQHLGLIRMSHLRRTHLLGAHVGSDINLLAELTLYGKFVELPQRLYFRRMHKDSGSWKRGDKEHEARRYHAAGRRSAPMARWPRHVFFFRAVARSPLPPKSKLRIYRTLLRGMIWDRRGLMDEVVDRARSIVGSVTHRVGP